MPKLKKTIFNDQYEVSLDYKKPDGYWVISHKEHVSIPLVGRLAANEKGNHPEAARIAKLRFPGCRINSVSYC
jgi:hypothetical protein